MPLARYVKKEMSETDIDDYKLRRAECPYCMNGHIYFMEHSKAFACGKCGKRVLLTTKANKKIEVKIKS